MDITKQRLKKVQAALADRKLNGLIVQNRMSSLYLSGFPCSNSLLLITRTSAQFYTDFRYIETATQHIQHMEVLQMPQNTLTEVASNLSKMRLKRIGFEESVAGLIEAFVTPSPRKTPIGSSMMGLNPLLRAAE